MFLHTRLLGVGGLPWGSPWEDSGFGCCPTLSCSPHLNTCVPPHLTCGLRNRHETLLILKDGVLMCSLRHFLPVLLRVWKLGGQTAKRPRSHSASVIVGNYVTETITSNTNACRSGYINKHKDESTKSLHNSSEMTVVRDFSPCFHWFGIFCFVFCSAFFKKGERKITISFHYI